MSVVVGFDCSGSSFSAAVLRDKECLAEVGGLSTRAHLRLLFPSVCECLKRAELTFNDVDIVAVTNGPGSFTGLRLGVVTARTIAQITKCKLFGIDTLEALAMNAPGNSCVLAGLDARRGEIFAAFFDTSKKTPIRLTEDKAYTPSELCDKSSELKCKLALGSFVKPYGELFESKGVCVLDDYYAQVRGANAALIASFMHEEGSLGLQPFELVPFYLRSAEVQVHKTVLPHQGKPQQ